MKRSTNPLTWLSITVCAVCLCSSEARAQREGRPESEERTQFVYVEALNLLADQPGNARIDILYRIKADFFVAVKNNDAAFPWEFRRHGEILVELLDSADVSRAREIRRFELGSRSPTPELGKIDWHQGGASFTVSPGRYRLVLEATDLESERRFFDRSRIVQARDLRESSMQLSTPLFVAYDPSSALPGRVVPQNYGGNIAFRGKGAMLLEIVKRNAQPDSLRIIYSLAALKGEQEPAEATVSDTLDHQLPAIPGASLRLITADSGIAYAVDSSRSIGHVAVLVPMKTEQLPLRPTELHVTVQSGGQEATATASPLMVWPEMPASLRDVDYAIDALRYLIPDRERDSISQGPYDARRRNLEEFWKKKALSARRDYRELMEEYYLRVDYAAKEFATLKEADGSKTDRGKTFILYGPPTNVERTLSPTAGYQEVWVYEPLQKRFVFEDKGKSGDYVLISTGRL